MKEDLQVILDDILKVCASLNLDPKPIYLSLQIGQCLVNDEIEMIMADQTTKEKLIV